MATRWRATGPWALVLLQASLQRPMTTGNPDQADRDLKSILAEPRYRLNGPSLFDRVMAWLLEQLARLLSLVHFGTGGASLVQLVEAALALLVVVVAAVFVFALWRRRSRRDAAAAKSGARVRPAEDWFAEADRLALAGDYAAALRALTTAVATRVGGAWAWDLSPLTVRELFVKAALLPELRPLLIPFEASVYGHRQPDLATYAGAADVALPFRQPAPAEAAA